jgi:hypothetical protein
MPKTKPILIGGAVGCAIGMLFLVFSFLTAFGICSDTAFAEVLFPYSLAADPTLNDHALFALVLALVQYPLYGVLLGYSFLRKRGMLKVAIVGILILHIFAVGIAKSRVNDMWKARFAHMK